MISESRARFAVARRRALLAAARARRLDDACRSAPVRFNVGPVAVAFAIVTN